MAAGSIIIDLLMRTGSFTTDTKRAEKILADLEKQANKSSSAFKASFGGNLAATAVTRLASALAELPGKVLESVDAFNDVRDATGASIANISALDRIARETGEDLGVIETALVKMNQALNGAKAGSETAAALKAIGLTAAELKSQDPAEALLKISTALAGFDDNANKARITQILFGKSLKEVAPYLTDLAEKGQLVATVTEEQAKQAEDFRKKLFGLKADVEDLARAFTLKLIPALADASQWFGSTFLGAPKTADQLRDEYEKIQSFAESLQRRIDKAEAPGINLMRPFTDTDELRKQLEQFQAKAKQLREQFLRVQDQEADAATDQPAPKKDVGVVKDKADEDFKARSDNRIKAIEAAAKKEQDIQEELNKSLERAYAENFVSITDYFDQKRQAQNSATATAVAAYEREIAELKALRAQQDKQTEKATTTGRIADLQDRQAEVIRKNSGAIKQANDEQARATEAYEKQVTQLNADLLELQGNLAKAAELRFDLGNASLSQRAATEGDKSTLDGIKALREYQIAQAATNKLSADSSNILEGLSLQEERLSLSRQLGADTETTSLLKVGAARQAALKQLESFVIAEEAIAKASGNPALILNAEKARVALDQLRATADPLADKFNAIFSEGLGDAFGDFVNGTKTASEAFKSFANTVISQLARIAAQELATAAVAKASGLFGSLSGLFGFGSSSGKTAGTDGMFSAGADATAALPEFATGTNYIPRDNFPAILHKGEAVVPAAYNPAAGGSGGMAGDTYIYNVPAGITRNELVTSLQVLQKSMRSETDKKLRDKGIS